MSDQLEILADLIAKQLIIDREQITALTARIVKLEEGLLTVKNIIVRWNSESDFDDGGLLELIEGVLK